MRKRICTRRIVAYAGGAAQGFRPAGDKIPRFKLVFMSPRYRGYAAPEVSLVGLGALDCTIQTMHRHTKSQHTNAPSSSNLWALVGLLAWVPFLALAWFCDAGGR